MTGSTETSNTTIRRGDMTATQFLTELFTETPSGKITTWELARKRTYYWPGPRVGEHHDQQPDVFFGVGLTARERGRGRRPGNDEVCALAGLYLDIDGVASYVDGDASVKAWIKEYLPTPPTIVVDSGHGLHAYYLFDGGPWVFRSVEDREAARRLIRGWVALHPAADRGASDLARVLRLPGTINNKDPLDPRLVRVISSGGPRHDVLDLMALVPVGGPHGCGDSDNPTHRNGRHIDLAGDTSGFVAKLDALLDLSPEFERRWWHREAPADPSLSAYDLSLCTLAAGAMTDAELAKLIDMHRCQFGTGEDIMKGHREKYLRDTIAKARASADRDRAMRELES